MSAMILARGLCSGNGETAKAVLKAKLLGPGPIWRYAVGVSACGLRLTPGFKKLEHYPGNRETAGRCIVSTLQDDVHY